MSGATACPPVWGADDRFLDNPTSLAWPGTSLQGPNVAAPLRAGNGRLRRNLVVPARSGQGRFTI
jgi:hypothetical protein